MLARELVDHIEAVAPLAGQASWDASGVQLAGRKQDVSKLAVMLDPLPDLVGAALDWGAQFILTHHPLGLEALRLDRLNTQHDVVSQVLGAQSWLYAAHTSLDVQPEGPVGWLARELGLTDVSLLEVSREDKLQGVRFHAGRDMQGLVNFLETVPGVLHLQEPAEEELFLVCAESHWPEVKRAVASRLQTPAFAPMELTLQGEKWGFGLAGSLPEPVPFRDFCASLASTARRRFYQLVGPQPETVSRVAYCTGSGSSFMNAAKHAGADVFITGDVKYHQALEAPLSVIDVGHFILEEEMMRRFAQQLADSPRFEDVEVLFFPGQDPFDLLLLNQEPGELL